MGNTSRPWGPRCNGRVDLRAGMMFLLPSPGRAAEPVPSGQMRTAAGYRTVDRPATRGAGYGYARAGNDGRRGPNSLLSGAFTGAFQGFRKW